MGVTSKSRQIISDYWDRFDTVCELGAQNLYTNEVIVRNPEKYPYASEMYELHGKKYTCIDLNGDNGAKKWNLDKPLKTKDTFDLVTDFGTSEHCHNYYQVLANIHKLCKVGGIIIRENPETGSWPGHGNNYITEQFYRELCEVTEYQLLHLERWPAMGNYTDGWNIIAVMQKTKEEFITKEQLPQYYTK